MTELWAYLAHTPLLWLALTLATYLLASEAARRSSNHALCNPVLLAVLMLIGLLQISGTSYATFFEGAQFIHFLLGPATVALAVPLVQVIHRVRQMALPLTLALGAGALAAIGGTMLLAQSLGLDTLTLRSLLPRSVTTPIAMGVAEQIGGEPSLTAALVILTGMIGALIANDLLRLLRVEEPAIRGFAIGLAAHGIGTARALQLHAEAGAFATLGMILNGALTAVLLPILVY